MGRAYKHKSAGEITQKKSSQMNSSSFEVLLIGTVQAEDWVNRAFSEDN